MRQAIEHKKHSKVKNSGSQALYGTGLGCLRHKDGMYE